MTKPPKPLGLQLRLNRKCMTLSQDLNIGHIGQRSVTCQMLSNGILSAQLMTRQEQQE